MRRLVVALTALLTMGGAAVVVGYLLLFAATGDRAARAAPGDSALYLNIFLQPSSGQKLDLLALIGRLPGFRDDATREEKIHEVAQRLLGDTGIGYAADVRPWLGGELALAAAPPGEGGAAPQLVLLAAVKDLDAARVAVPRLLARPGVTYTPERYRGRQAMTSKGLSYALLEDLLVVANTPDRLRAALDAEADTIPSMADLPAFGSAMQTIPADRLAALYIDPGLAAGLEPGQPLGGFGAAALAVTAGPGGLHLDGSVPFSAGDASESARAAFRLGTRTGALAGWMPRTTPVELSLFGLQQSLADLEGQVGSGSLAAPVLDALGQLRLIAGIGLGVNVDRDLLSLFDGEVALAITKLDPVAPRGVLLLRPSDPAAAQLALDTMRDALRRRGSAVRTSEAGGTTITIVAVPQLGRVAYAVADGVIVAGLDQADLAAALEAHRSATNLAGDGRYEPAFEVAGAHAGNELWADIPSLLDAAAAIFDPGSEVRDILNQIGELAMSASTVDDHLEIHAVLTVR